MQYRSFGKKTDFRPSALGFGCMRYPQSDGHIDEAEAIRMIRYAVDQGVNYFDTAYNYHDGHSEPVLGKALDGGLRDQVKIATKVQPWLVSNVKDCEKIVTESLKRLRTDHIDYYLLHALNAAHWDKIKRIGMLKWAEGLLASGRIRHLGFSFHDELDVFKRIIDDYDGFTFCQIQYNYMDEHFQAGREGLEYAAQHGLGVVVMEPLRGGRLAEPNEQIGALMQGGQVQRSPVEWALQWLWDQPQVSTVLSGMSAMEQVQQNVVSAAGSSLHPLTGDDHRVIAAVRAAYEAGCPIPCTRCRYCMPCPNGVEIPDNLGALNEGLLSGDLDAMRTWYAELDPAGRASACIQCKICEEQCPQHIPISQWMPIIDDVIGKGMAYDSGRAPK